MTPPEKITVQYTVILTVVQNKYAPLPPEDACDFVSFTGKDGAQVLTQATVEAVRQPDAACVNCGETTGPFRTLISTPHPETGEDPITWVYCHGCGPFRGPDHGDQGHLQANHP
ncbi:hypothetical protein DESA109040_02370 [Deinococcus saxicola]|uniref:hypothetical protein n=1 Tax=Deinococcus saxicola TaxID=249406 RepID=UPI0039EE4535